jgi:hypothetical protein
LNKVGWILVGLILVLFIAGCKPLVEIRLVPGTDLTATAASSDTRAATTTVTAPPPDGHELPVPASPVATTTTGQGLDATRIRFQVGATSAVVSGKLEPHDARLYVLRASAGQLMQIALAPPSSGVSFRIWGENGTVLKAWAEKWAATLLPSSQDYYVGLYAGKEATAYDLSVTIIAVRGSGLTRVQFRPGASSVATEGSLEPGTCVTYVLRALHGQKMEVHVVAGEDVGLAVLDQDGSLWGSGSPGNLIVEQLPQTGDYYLMLCLPAWTTAAFYTLEVVIPPG